MNWHYTYAVITGLAGVLSLSLASVAWSRRRGYGVRYFTLLMFAVSLWSLASAAELTFQDAASKILWSQVSYIGIVSVGPLWLLLALSYSNRLRHWSRFHILLLGVIPLATLALVATNQRHGLIWSRITPVSNAPGAALMYVHGIGFWIYAVYTYVLMLGSAILLVRTAIRSPQLYRRQIGALLLGAVLPWLGNLWYLLRLPPLPELDKTPIAFALSGVIVAYGLFRFRLFDIVPVAREALIESLPDGVLVLDEHGQLIDVNPAACRLLGYTAAHIVGRPIAVVLERWADLVERFEDHTQVQTEIAVHPGRWFDLTISPLYDQRQELSGRLIVLRDITERKQASEALQKSEEKYRTLVRNIPIGVYRTTAGSQGRFLMANPAFLTIFGFESEAELAQVNVADMYHDPAERTEFSDKLLTQGHLAGVELLLQRKDHKPIWGSVTAQVVYNNDGKVAWFDCTIENITERKQAEQALRASEARNRAIVAALPDIFFQIDAYNRFIDCHANKPDDLLIPPEQVIGRHIDEILPPALAELTSQKVQQTLTSGAMQVYEYVVPIQGAERHFEARMTVSGPRTVLALVRDITDLKRAAEALRTSEARYRSLIEQSNDAIYLLYDDHFELINPRFEALFGITQAEARAPDFDFLSLVAPQSLPLVEERGRQLQAGQTLAPHYEFTALTRTGQEIEVEVSVSYIAYRDGFATQGILRDVSERKHAEREQQYLLERVQRQQKTVVALSLHPAFSSGDVVTATRFLTETIAEMLEVTRTSVWLLENEGTELRCHDLYLYDEATHQSGQALTAAHFPAYFAALKQGRAIDAHDARRDPRTHEFDETYLKPTGIVSMLDATIRLSGEMVGVVSLEHAGNLREWQADEITFAGEVADQMAQVLTNAKRQQAEATLKTAQAYTRNIIDSSLDMIIAVDMERRIVEFNQAAQQTFGYRLEQVVGQHVDMLYADPQESLLVHQTTVQQGRCVREITNRRQNGELFPSQLSASCLRDANGEMVGVMGVSRDISDRKLAETKLLHAYDLMQYIIAHNRSAIAVHDRELRYVYVSQRYLDDFRVQEKDVIGKHHYEVFPDLPQKWRDVHQKALQGEISSAEDDIFEREDGTVDWTRWECRPWYEADGTIGGIIIYTEVITDRIQAEAELRQERDLTRALADAAAAVSRTLDPDEVLDRLLEQLSQVIPNDTANIMLIEDNHQVRVVRGRNYAHYRTESFIGALNYEIDQVPTLRRMAETGDPLVIADTATDPDWVNTPEHTWIRAYLGAPILARGIAVGFINVNSATPNAFTLLHADILRAFADHAAISLENARIAHDLRQSEQRYRRLFERSNDAIFLIDRRTGQYLAANAAAEKLTGRTGAELQQLTTHDVTPEGADERLARAATAQQALNMGEVQYVRPDGAIRTALLDLVPLDAHTAFGIARDITEQKEIEKRLRRQEQLAAIGQLASGIAHDFRNLLTTIILYAQLGQRKPDLPPAVAQYLKTINVEARKATELVQQILDFARRTDIERRPLDLVPFVSDVIAVLQRTLPENIHVTLDVGAGACVIEGDAGRWQQVLTNLALNARDAMPDGGTLHIGLSEIVVEPGDAPPLPEMVERLVAPAAIAPPAWIYLSVSDTGIGMTEDAYAHLFEPFFTTKEEGQGTGLGLAQVYGIVQLHNGYIDVTTGVEKGTTFHIYLPAATTTKEVNVAPASIPLGQGQTLLLVEDNTQLREAAQNLLTDIGYRVLTATNGQEALAIYQSGESISLLVTDLVMPEMGGKALLQALRNHTPHLKALVMTGYTAEESEADLRNAGFLEVIRKPLDAEQLASAIHRALET